MKYHIEIETELKRNPHKGLYIALEGIDGSGKTTQVERLKTYFGDRGREVVLTREPRKVGIVAEMNAKVLEGSLDLPREAFQYLFTIDRLLNHRDVVIPALKRGAVVLSDRCFWSAVAYGVWDMGSKYREDTAKRVMVAQGILSMQLQFTAPDLTFYLSLLTKSASKRLQATDKKKEIYEKDEILEVVCETYEWLLKEFPDEFNVINAEQNIEQVTESMIQVIEKSEKI